MLVGATASDSKNDTNLMLTSARQLSEAVQLQTQYTDDMKICNGGATKGAQACVVFSI